MEPHAKALAYLMLDQAVRKFFFDKMRASPFKERKLHYQEFLAQLIVEGGFEHHVKEAADEAMSALAGVQTLELYLPFRDQRDSWDGVSELQVVTLVHDNDTPVAFSGSSLRRDELSRTVQPIKYTAVLTPAEQHFDRVAYMPGAQCDPDVNPGCEGGGGGGGTSDPPPTPPDTSLYMTRLKIFESYESIFKGDPEFEVHILGPNGSTDSLRSHQCSGEHAGGPYAFDYNNIGSTWTGKVLLFSKTQLASYSTLYSGKAFRVLIVEDDTDSCELRLDATAATAMINTIATAYPALSGAKDTTVGFMKYIKAGDALHKLISKASSFITTNDDIVGIALEDVVVGQSFGGSNWIVRGPGNATTGHMKLELTH